MTDSKPNRPTAKRRLPPYTDPEIAEDKALEQLPELIAKARARRKAKGT